MQHRKLAMIWTELVLLVFTGYSLAASEPQCYLPNGAVQNGTYACNPSDEHSACCQIGDICTNVGFCLGGISTTDKNVYWRNSCTDKTWRSKLCPRNCGNNNTAPDANSTWWKVYRCDTATFCCTATRSSTVNCCNDSSRVFERNPYGSSGTIQTKPYTSGDNITTTKNGTTSTISSNHEGTSTNLTAPNNPEHASSATETPQTNTLFLDRGTIAGIVIGAFAASVLATAAAFFLIKRKMPLRKTGLKSDQQSVKLELDGHERRKSAVEVSAHSSIYELGDNTKSRPLSSWINIRGPWMRSNQSSPRDPRSHIF